MSRNYYTIVTHPENPTVLTDAISVTGDASQIEFRKFNEDNGPLGEVTRRVISLKKLFELFEENDKLRAEIRSLENQVEDQKSIIEEQDKRLEDAKDYIARQAKQIMEKDARIAGHNIALGGKDAIIGIKDMRITKFEAEVRELRKTLSEKDAEIEKLKDSNNITNLNNSLMAKSKQLMEKEAMITARNLTIAAKDALIEMQKTECNTYKIENIGLKKTLVEKDEEIQVLKNKVFEGDTVAYRRLKSENEALNKTKERLDFLYTDSCEKLSSMAKERDVLRQTLAERDRDIDALKSCLAERDETINRQFETIKEFREGYSKIRSEIAYIRAAINTKWGLHPSAWSTSIWDECEKQIHEIRKKLIGLLNPVKTSLGVGVMSIDFNKWSKLRKKLSKKEVKLERLEREIKEIKDAMHKA